MVTMQGRMTIIRKAAATRKSCMVNLFSVGWLCACLTVMSFFQS
jgi:hypothetical protein